MGGKNVIGILVLTALVVLIPKAITNDYDLRLYTDIGLACIIVVGLSLFMGYAGQISLGHAGFYAIGAYTTGLLTTRLGMPPIATLFVGIALASTVAFLIGIPSLKLRGHYLAMATLGFCFVVFIIIKNAIPTSGGIEGIIKIPRLSVFGFIFKKQIPKFYLTWGTLTILMVLSLNIMKSRIGRACMAIHGNETAARVMGINTSRMKIQIFVISAIFASIAGSYKAFFDPYLGPETFSVDMSIHLVILVAVGGMTNLWTALSGAVFLSLLFTYLNDNWDFFKEYRILFDGAILMLIMMFFPRGLFITLAEKLRRWQVIKFIFKRQEIKGQTAK